MTYTGLRLLNLCIIFTPTLSSIFTDYFMYLKDCHHHKTTVEFLTAQIFFSFIIHRLDSNAVLNILVLNCGTAYVKT